MARRRNNYGMLLRIRKRQEDLRAITLAATRREVSNVEEQRLAISEEQRIILESAQEAARDRFDAAELRQYHQYERHLARLGVQSEVRLQELRNQAERQREDLVQASQKKKMVERLKENQDAALIQEYRKLEQEMANEVAVNYSVLRKLTEKNL